MTKMSDVAKLARVSTATVSRFFSSPGVLSQETRERVEAAIGQLDYQPNVLARNLRKLENRTVLVIVPDISNTFFSKILRGIQLVARSSGYKVLLCDTENDVELEKEYLNSLNQRDADGCILLTARLEKKMIEEIAVRYPLVLACEYYPGADISTVSIDNIGSASKATEHLISLGHKKIVHLTGPMNIILSLDRLAGYQQALLANGLAFDASLVYHGDFTYQSGYYQMKKIISQGNLPTAVFAANDEMAIGAIKAIREYGLQVPGDIAIVGFDNIEIASIFEPALTTIAQPMTEIGEYAMNLFLALTKDEKMKKRRYVLSDCLVIRSSCGYFNEMK